MVSDKLVKWLTALAKLTLLKVKFGSLLFVDLALKYYRKVNITKTVEKEDFKMLNMHRSIKLNDKFRWG